NRSAPGLDAHLATHPLRVRLNLRYVAAPDLAGAAHARNVGADHVELAIMILFRKGGELLVEMSAIGVGDDVCGNDDRG
ncbi:hypothetical protein GV789_28910, partial [Nocardia cyriacigeorgica]|nr:hypothetical protein [Nocardia cyriacigeorgica]